MDRRILIYAPTGKDARLISQVLHRTGLESYVCSQATEISFELNKGVGALFIVDEVLTTNLLKSITQYLKRQQTWSDLPIIVLSKRGLDSPEMRDIYRQLGNVTLLERPVTSVTLMSAATSALRARERQYEMRQIDRRKDEFLAMLAHELRNPLAPISAAAELLRLAKLDGGGTQRACEIISRQVRHMTGLIDDLLDLSRVSRGLITLEQTTLDARQILTHAVEQVRPLIDSRRHRLTLQIPAEPAYVLGDQKRLIQVITNLLNNAAKYTPESGNILLTMNIDARNISFSVSDDGIGIEQSVIEHVFEMFAQAERTPDRSQGGLGIGLALVKSLVELHKGSIIAQSDGKEKGSRFTVVLPRATGTSVSSNETSIDVAMLPSKSLRLLVVDDNQDAAYMLGLFLEAAGNEVMIEHNAKAALERACIYKPDVCLLDIGLPDMDGNELAKQLRTRAETANTILIAVTGYGQEQDREKTAHSGFHYHFVKPLDMEELLTILRK